MKRAITSAACQAKFYHKSKKQLEHYVAVLSGSILFVITDNRLPKNTTKVVKGREDGGGGGGGGGQSVINRFSPDLAYIMI